MNCVSSLVLSMNQHVLQFKETSSISSVEVWALFSAFMIELIVCACM